MANPTLIEAKKQSSLVERRGLKFDTLCRYSYSLARRLS